MHPAVLGIQLPTSAAAAAPALRRVFFVTIMAASFARQTAAMSTSSASSSRGQAFASSLPPLPAFTKRLILARHGQTDWNAQGLMQGGGFDIELNAEGRQQGQLLADELSELITSNRNVAIASSHLKRALQTASYLWTDEHQQPLKSDARFGEMRFGDFEGLAIHGPKATEETRSKFQTMQEKMSSDIHFRMPGNNAESTLEVSQRGVAGITELLVDSSDLNESLFCVVAHGRFNKILLSSLLYNDPSRYTEFEQSNTCINVLDYNKQTEQWKAVVLNYTDHAPTAYAKFALS